MSDQNGLMSRMSGCAALEFGASSRQNKDLCSQAYETSHLRRSIYAPSGSGLGGLTSADDQV